MRATAWDWGRGVTGTAVVVVVERTVVGGVGVVDVVGTVAVGRAVASVATEAVRPRWTKTADVDRDVVAVETTD